MQLNIKDRKNYLKLTPNLPNLEHQKKKSKILLLRLQAIKRTYLNYSVDEFNDKRRRKRKNQKKLSRCLVLYDGSCIR